MHDLLETVAGEGVDGQTPPAEAWSARAWFAGGERIGYDPRSRAIVASEDAPLRIFLRQEGDPAHAVSFLPGFPDGSFGWVKVRSYLPNATEMPKLFLDYVGMGDSDKPKDYAYSTSERADLAEAIWRELGVQSTTLVAFDFSSLVVLELLRRRLERSARGERVGRPFALFKRVPGVRKMWSKGYHVTDTELRELHSAMDRHDGLFYLAAAAGFVADHQAQGDRLDFGHIYQAYRDQFPFLLGGSDEDPFEHRQVDPARERLGKFGLRTERLPGGHLTTNERPEALAALIENFERGTTIRLPHPSVVRVSR